ncbi:MULTISPECIES: acyltransferase domain-containing protein [Sorangium]|uniref:acyltransferase domain-containing protein n=1 Tax=Sorangium TaxID=39643 RepID=UPI00101A69CB|nr:MULTISPECIES: acyltransferase domain-containing protein [Sorangium]
MTHVEARRSLVLMAGGQGCQYYHMAAELYQKHSTFRRAMQEGDRIAHRMLRTSILDVIYDERRSRLDTFDDIRFTHPAILIVQHSFGRMILDWGVRPAHVLGYSLGELVVNILAGAVSLEDAIFAAVVQAELVAKRCPVGGMMAVLGSPRLLEAHDEVFSGCSLACINFDGHFVVAGRKRELHRAADLLATMSISTQVLPVNYAFHTSMMTPAREDLELLFDAIRYARPATSVISSNLAGPAPGIGGEHFWQVARGPVMFGKTIDWLESRGPHLYVDLSPSGTLAAFAKRILGDGASESAVLPSLTMYGRDCDRVRELMSALKELGAA